MNDSNPVGEGASARDLSAGTFRIWLISAVILFLALESMYIVRFPLVMDEYVNAGIVHSLTKGIAYRDVYSPKTVLGFYSQLPVLASVPDAWQALLAVKFEMVLMTLAATLFAAVLMARSYSRAAVAVALVLLLAMNTFNERCAEFRSDTPTAVFGLIGLVLLLRRQWAAAGFACAVSLMMSQKAAYYVLGSEAALGVAFLLARDRARFTAGVTYNAALAGGFAAYLVFFSLLAGWRAVFTQTFVGPAPIAFTTIYQDLRRQFWTQTLLRNQLFYIVAAAAILYLIYKAGKGDERAWLLAPYVIVVTALCAWHKQPWPYFFVILVPTLFVAQIALLDAARLWLRDRPASFWMWSAAIMVFGALVPLAARLPAALARDSSYQRFTFRLGNELLQEGGTYFAGVPFLYEHPQALGDKYSTLDAFWLYSLNHTTEQEQLEIVRKLDAAPMRLLVYNYRLGGMPPMLRAYAQSTFAHYWGAIFIYAPRIAPGRFSLHFDADYEVDSRGAGVTIDGQAVAHGARVRLPQGAHQLEAQRPIRLTLAPKLAAPLDPRYRLLRELFPAIYGF